MAHERALRSVDALLCQREETPVLATFAKEVTIFERYMNEGCLSLRAQLDVAKSILAMSLATLAIYRKI